MRAGWFRVVELAASILEFADRGRTHGSALAGRPIEAPLAGLGIVQTQRHTFDVTARRAVGFELLQLSATIPNLSGYGSTVKFDPGCGARQGMNEPLQVNLPSTELEIKIVLPIAFRGSVLHAIFRRV